MQTPASKLAVNLHNKRKLGSCLVLLLLAACNGSDPGTQANTGLAMPAPAMLRAYDKDDLSLILSIDDQIITTEHNRDNDQWLAEFVIPNNQQVALSLSWRSQQHDITLASLERSLGPFTADQVINLNEDDYQSDYHCDNDGHTNLEELIAGSDPCDGNSPGEINIDVSIPRINPVDAPLIDGLYDAIWDNAVYTNTNHETLLIDNLMIGEDPLREDGNTEFQWSALHDGTYLYLFAYGENVGIATLHDDSAIMWGDDTLEVYLDGNNSKQSTYDGFDDRQILIPLLKYKSGLAENNSRDVNGRYMIGANSAQVSLNMLSFDNCRCSVDRHTFEIRIRLADANIQVGQPFGIDIQYNDDQDGRGRDSKWGWIHPSKTTDEDVDLTWQNPSLMGIGILE